jgi:hypothetical protein
MFEQLCKKESDINEHLPTLRDLASECNHVTEMGVRGIVSSYAFVEGLKPNDTLICIDFIHPKIYGANFDIFQTTCSKKGIKMEFRLGDTRKIDIGETDLLFIDTDHKYEQLRCELERHADKAKKYLAFHDTTTFATMGDDGIEGHGLWKAIQDFLDTHKEWKLLKRYENNNGLTILQRC